MKRTRHISLLRNALFAGLAAFTLAACNRDLDAVPEHLDNIYPLDQGKVRIYAAVDTNYASIFGREGRSYFIREEVDGMETDLQGRDLTTLWTYESPDSVDSLGNRQYLWTFRELWTQYKDDVYAERTEGNTRYLVLKLPPMEDTKWNGNLYNSLGARTYEVTTHDTTVTVQGQTYEHCVYVLKAPFYVTIPSPVYYRKEFAYEIYAPGIGMIVRHDEQIVIQNPGSPPNNVWDPDENESWYLHMEIVSHN